MNHKIYLLPILLCLLQLTAFSQDKTDSTVTITVEENITITHNSRSYMTWGGDGALLSFGNIKYAGESVHNIPRFTLFFNVGNNYNYDLDRHFGIFTGLNLKNIGLITKENDSVKLKRRVYTVGIPLGIKIGDLRGGTFFFAGGSYDLAFNYKEKQFLNGDKRHKFNEWFSNRTPLLMPSVFAGIRFSPGFGLKVQYYPNNFFNREYKQTINGVTTQPAKDVESKMFFATLSYDFGKEISHPSAKVHWERKTKHWEKR
ncbi:hypothetical protein SAMN05428988_1737 [Chitinophaga sp. YR573]|uniref:hypothetical protein n=1 Tax=Chitinophaga sp. YR573 TaxID=1881040 RepID=UPI0008C61498|nr:hypothetical protein [Chitinophaga sp. YR573]SEW06750.1 hypothetical protein SAMN05428988_1737 [Chitinophaga sp. YR573]